MKIGICTALEKIQEMAAVGFDYIEPPVSAVATMDEAAFASLEALMNKAPIRPEAFNMFIPRTLKTTGPEVDMSAIRQYMETAIRRVSRLGGEVIVFGSGGSRQYPEGWPADRAFDQYVEAAALAGGIGARYGVTIALEHLNRKETNLVNTVAEAWEAARQARQRVAPGPVLVRVLVDFYHMRLENESFGILETMDGEIAHLHIANSHGRVYPLSPEEDAYGEFFDSIRKIGYDKRISIEASTSDMAAEAPAALALMRRMTS